MGLGGAGRVVVPLCSKITINKILKSADRRPYAGMVIELYQSS